MTILEPEVLKVESPSQFFLLEIQEFVHPNKLSDCFSFLGYLNPETETIMIENDFWLCLRILKNL